MKLITIIGARPQFIKAAALNRAFKTLYGSMVREILVHTGQHYDNNMSEVFFRDLKLDTPGYHLNVGSAGHGQQTGQMLTALEEVLLKEKPNGVIVYGDTNSTLAGALAAAKLHIPVVHVEAGIRSFNKAMPEEVNRILTDHVSTLLFTPSDAGFQNLMNEGFKATPEGKISADNPKVYRCGDIMYDNSLYYGHAAEASLNLLDRWGLYKGGYFLCTVHRDHNTDNPERLRAILKALRSVVEKYRKPLVLPLHPRTRKQISAFGMEELIDHKDILIKEPQGFLEMSLLEKNCLMVITDSGGLQKEAYFFGKPVVTLRPETEWVEIVQQGCGRLADADESKIVEAIDYFMANLNKLNFPPMYGDGKAAEFIAGEILAKLG